MGIAKYLRYKKDIPFSPLLNIWVEFEYSRLINEGFKIKHTDKEYEFEYLKYIFNTKNKLIVSSENCDNNIFGDKDINIKFRAIHDYIHYIYNYDFSLDGETETYNKQLERLNSYSFITDWERDLLRAEVIGQTLHFVNEGFFPKNQRRFTIEYLLNQEKDKIKI